MGFEPTFSWATARRLNRWATLATLLSLTGGPSQREARAEDAIRPPRRAFGQEAPATPINVVIVAKSLPGYKVAGEVSCLAPNQPDYFFQHPRHLLG